MKKTLAAAAGQHQAALAAWMVAHGVEALMESAQPKVERTYLSLVEARLEEEASEPVFGGFVGAGGDERCAGGVYEVTSWLMDGQINLED